MPKVDNTLISSPSDAFLGNPISTAGPFPVTTTNANAPISGLTAGGQIRVVVIGGPVRIAWGVDNTIAIITPTPGTLASGKYSGGTLGSQLVLPGTEILSAPPGTAFVAFKSDAAGTATIEFTPGGGV